MFIITYIEKHCAGPLNLEQCYHLHERANQPTKAYQPRHQSNENKLLLQDYFLSLH